MLGTATVALIGVVAWETFGMAAALAALALAAVYPVLIELSGILAAENLLTVLVLAALAAGLRIGTSKHPYLWTAAAGVLAGVATLSHLNGFLILIPLAFAAVPAARGSRGNRQSVGRWRALIGPVLLVSAAALTIAPWTIRNAVVLHRFIPVSDETGITLVGTYNPASAASSMIPYKWRIYYGIPGERTLIRESGQLTEPQLGDRLLDQAFDYIVRLLLAISVVLVNVETPRFRAPADPFLVLLAACGVATAAARLPALAAALRRTPLSAESGAAAPSGGGQHVEVLERPA